MKLVRTCLLCLVFLSCRSQNGGVAALPEPRHRIIGEEAALSHFFEALDALKKDSCRTLSIVHIGDSHIQADYFSGMLRVLLQEKFGNAGRGLIFPYAVAHTNEPVNYSSGSAGEWKAVRSVINPAGAEVGLSGISLYSLTGRAGFRIRTKPQKNMSYAFNRLELISKAAHPGNTRLFTNDGATMPGQKEASFMTVFDLRDTTSSVDIKYSASQAIDVHGLILKNGQGGILYHTIGVNGATFESYNSASLFMEQFSCLHPDLIIISLGTNESYDHKLDTAAFAGQMQRFLEALKPGGSSCSILLTTPADNCFLKKGKAQTNNRPRIVGNYLKAYAGKNAYAVWDLYEEMGGPGAMKQWKQQGLATGDYVHFTRKGYELQGLWLFEALMYQYTQKH